MIDNKIGICYCCFRAEVVKLVDTSALGADACKGMEVRVLSSALICTP